MADHSYDGSLQVESILSGDPNGFAVNAFRDAVVGMTYTDPTLGHRWWKDTSTTWRRMTAINSLAVLADCGPFYINGAYLEVTPGGTPFPTNWTWYVRPASAFKVYEVQYTYSGAKVLTVTRIAYEADGITADLTATDTITYTGAFESSRVRVLS